ncbi:MAG TPA: hypothetical protein DDW52_19375 [Planctomycetaceae bacterium]|nr:hypothetical protein [Planctomycetaceae bacterium]
MRLMSVLSCDVGLMRVWPIRLRYCESIAQTASTYQIPSCAVLLAAAILATGNLAPRCLAATNEFSSWLLVSLDSVQFCNVGGLWVGYIVVA